MDLWLATLILIMLTALPLFELRASIPLGILTATVHLPLVGDVGGLGLPWWYVFLIAVLANAGIGILLYVLIDKVVHKLLLPRWQWFARHYHKQVERTQAKLRKEVDKYGWIGLAIFIGVPLPGTGVYSGAVAGYALGMDFKKYAMATVLGVLIAAAAVTAITMGAVHLL